MSAKEKKGKRYRLKILGIQRLDGEEVENCLDTMAVYYQVRDKVYLFYDEYQEDGSVQSCRLVISPGEVELKKRGSATSVLRFCQGKKIACRYQSPMGELNLCSHTRRMSTVHEPDTPHLRTELEYELYMGDSLMSEYELVIELN